MFVGNEFAQEVLTKIFEKINIDNKISVPFLIMSGPNHIGKTTLILEKVKKLLGNFIFQDFLHIQDFTEKLGKKHILKIEYKSGETSDLLNKNYNYKDIGVREINERLSQSSISGKKIVLIENIERMTTQATNALLKTCEEPIDGNIIIATTKSLDYLLDTIVSRAFILQMQTVDKPEMLKLANQIFPNKKPDEIQESINISMGKPGILYQLQEQEKQEYYSNFWEKIKNIENFESISDKFLNLQDINKDYDINLFFDYILNKDYSLGDKFVNLKKMRNANVNKDSLLLKIAKIL